MSLFEIALVVVVLLLLLAAGEVSKRKPRCPG